MCCTFVYLVINLIWNKQYVFFIVQWYFPFSIPCSDLPAAVAGLAVWAADETLDDRKSAFGRRHLDLLGADDPAAEFRVVVGSVLVVVDYLAAVTCSINDSTQ